MATPGPGMKTTASAAEEPVVAGSSSVLPVGEVFDGGVIMDPPPSSERDERSNESAVLGDEADDLSDADEDISSDDEDVDIDIDSEFEEDDDNDQVPTTVNNGGAMVAVLTAGMFLGESALITTVGSTVAFTKIKASPPCHCQHCSGSNDEIIVLYRYTRFLRAQSGGDAGASDGVDMHVLGPKQARLRFVLPRSSFASDAATALRLAGAAVASLVYPARFSAQLQALWSRSVTKTGPWAMRNVFPPGIPRLVVLVDAGILRPGDLTPERMASMRAAMESMAQEREEVPTPVNVRAELLLPAALFGSAEHDVLLTNRRKVAGEDCPICWEELLEEGVAAWPRCSHIFHAGCLEQHLLRGRQECPLCRSELKISPAPGRK